MGQLAYRKEWLFKSDAQRAADWIHRRARPLPAGTVFACGPNWQRAHLFATARGLAARPCNEAVEMVDHERALDRPAFSRSLLNEITGDPMWQPTFVFYMGYPTLPAHASPRRPIQAVLV